MVTITRDQGMGSSKIDSSDREERRTEATRQINATLAKLVAVERHDVVRQQLLAIIAGATGYRYAMLSEMEEDERHLRIVAAHAPTRVIHGAEMLLGFKMIGHRVVNEPDIVLKTPPTEIFNHLCDWRAEIPRSISLAIEFLTGVRQIASIRLHTGDYYLGVANFFATKSNTDLPLLEYLCNNHLVYAVRLIQEQAARERLQTLRTQELQQEIQVRQHAEEAIRALYTITADQKMDFSEKMQALLSMGCRRFGMTIGVFSHIIREEYHIAEIYAPETSLKKGDVLPLSGTYCCEVIATDKPLSFEQASQSEWAKHPCYKQFQLEAYLGTAIRVQTQQGQHAYGTLSFSSPHARKLPFKPSDHEFLNLMAQWIGGEIERQQRTEQLQAYATQLEQTHQKLAEAHSRALEVSRLKSEFLATMSHEIRTPMNGIIGMTELLTTTDLNERQRNYVSIVLKESDHLLLIINNILDFSKMEAGKLTLSHEGFSPLLIVESVASIMAPQATAKKLALMTYVAPDVPAVVYGDASRLRQILLNLVGNAIKFTDQGDVLVTLTSQIVTEDSVQIYCKVTDSGIGIEEHEQKDIFYPFTQVDGGVTRRHGGTGLGLAIASRLVNMMEGEIGVESTPGQGSTFWFTATFNRPSASCDEIKEETKALDGIRVLVIDDRESHAQIVQNYLRSWGAVADHAPSHVEGYLYLKEAVQNGDPYQLAIVEQRPPTVDGLYLGRQVKNNPALAATVLTLLTSVESAEQRTEAAAIGFHTYLTKPLRQTEFYNSMWQQLRSETSPTQQTNGIVPQLSTSTTSPHGDELTRSHRTNPSAGPTILLVEDQEENQMVTVEQLRLLGYTVAVANNGQTALQLLATPTHTFQLVLMDCQMPEMDGLETTRQIRGQEAGTNQHIPIVAMTAQVMPGDKERCYAVGMDDYLAKPLRIGELRNVLQQWLPRRAQ